MTPKYPPLNPEQKDALTQTLQGLIQQFGLVAVKSATTRARIALAPPEKPKRKRNFDMDAYLRSKERARRQAELAAHRAEAAERVREAEEERRRKIRREVFAEMRIVPYVRPDVDVELPPDWQHCRPGLPKAIRTTTKAAGASAHERSLSLPGAWLRLEPGMVELIAWERRRLGRLGAKLDLLGVRLMRTPQQKASQARRNAAANAGIAAHLDARLRRIAPILMRLHHEGRLAYAGYELTQAGVATARGAGWRVDYVRKAIQQIIERLSADPAFLSGLDAGTVEDWRDIARRT